MDLVILDVSYFIFPTGQLVLGPPESTLLYNRVSVLSFIIISGFIMGDLHNWKLTEQDYALAAAVFSNRLGVYPWSY